MENINKLKIKSLKTLIIDSKENIDYELSFKFKLFIY